MQAVTAWEEAGDLYQRIVLARAQRLTTSETFGIYSKSSLRAHRASGRHDSHASPSIVLADNSFFRRAEEELRFQQHEQGRYESA